MGDLTDSGGASTRSSRSTSSSSGSSAELPENSVGTDPSTSMPAAAAASPRSRADDARRIGGLVTDRRGGLVRPRRRRGRRRRVSGRTRWRPGTAALGRRQRSSANSTATGTPAKAASADSTIGSLFLALGSVDGVRHGQRQRRLGAANELGRCVHRPRHAAQRRADRVLPHVGGDHRGDRCGDGGRSGSRNIGGHGITLGLAGRLDRVRGRSGSAAGVGSAFGPLGASASGARSPAECGTAGRRIARHGCRRRRLAPQLRRPPGARAARFVAAAPRCRRSRCRR